MQSLFSLEVLADDLRRERLAQAAQAALIAQLPHSPTPRPDRAARVHVASRLRALAVRLDPYAAPEPPLVAATPR